MKKKEIATWLQKSRQHLRSAENQGGEDYICYAVTALLQPLCEGRSGAELQKIFDTTHRPVTDYIYSHFDNQTAFLITHLKKLRAVKKEVPLESPSYWAARDAWLDERIAELQADGEAEWVRPARLQGD